MKAFVTGINGFVGPYLKEELEANDYSVHGMDRKKSAGTIACDILDKAKLTSIIKNEKPDSVIHLAGQSSVEKSYENPKTTMDINVSGTKNLLDAIVAAKIKPRILIVSSSEVYASSNAALDEHSEIDARSPYARSRLQQEKIALSYGLPIVVSRSFNHTGPGQPDSFVYPNFAKQIAQIEKGKKEPVLLTGNIDVKRDFSDVRDVVRAYRLLIEKANTGQIYNVCSGNAVSIADNLQILRQLSTKDFEIRQEKTRVRQSDHPFIQGNNSKLIKDTGWKPKISFRQTLSDVLDFWRAENL